MIFKNLRDYSSGRKRSLLFALNGLLLLFRSEPNMRLHLAITFLVLTAGICMALNGRDWCLVSIAIAIVWIAEAINTAIERLCNLYSEKQDKRIGAIKDISAAAVLIASVFALVIGLFVFIPHFFPL